MSHNKDPYRPLVNEVITDDPQSPFLLRLKELYGKAKIKEMKKVRKFEKVIRKKITNKVTDGFLEGKVSFERNIIPHSEILFICEKLSKEGIKARFIEDSYSLGTCIAWSVDFNKKKDK